MSLFKEESTIINIKLPEKDAVENFLTVYLSKHKLPKGQLDIITELVAKYAKYIKDGVAEPYASALLFSTESRKEVHQALGISAAQLNNAFKPLIDKNILAKEDGKYFINPNILPSKTLTFNFYVSAK